MSDDFNSFSFESILAEIKGSAFINGDKRTPPDLLQEQADRILREAAEMTESSKPVMPDSIAPQTITTATRQTTGPIVVPQTITPVLQQQAEPATPQTITSAIQQTAMQQTEATGHDPRQYAGFYPEQHTAQYPEQDRVELSYRRPDTGDLSDISAGMYRVSSEPDFSDTDDIPMIVTPFDDEVLPDRQETAFSSFSTAMDAAVSGSSTIVIPKQDSVQTTQQSMPYDMEPVSPSGQYRENVPQEMNQDTMIYNEEQEERSKWSLKRKNRSTVFDQDIFSEEEDPERETGFFTAEDGVYEEPELRDAARKFAASCNSISVRVIPATVITLLMVLITYVYEAGMVVPFGIGYNLEYAAGTLIICLLIVMMLCSDLIVRGVDFLVRGVPNAESLILFSCVFSLLSASFTMISGAAPMLPFCAVSAMSLTFAAHGERYNLRAITDTLKTASGSSEPFGVQAEYNSEIDKSILKKVFNRTDGFYNNLMQPDITEYTYNYSAPVLLVATLLLTILVVIVRGGAENSLHIMSALLAAAAPFSALLSFSVPFATVVRSIRRSGAAIAGWGGADDICFTDGVCVTDDDLFPPGMLKLSGVKVYDGASPENAIRYTASLILSSGSGLTSLFSEVLKQQGLSAMRVDDFECHESGIGALIRGEQVSTGSAAFMNLLGVRVPDDTNMKNAVYTAVNNRLVAMFAVDYKPLPSVQAALISMLKWRIDLYFAMRDFNVTPAMVGQKFKVPFDSFVFIPAKDSYSLSDLYSGKAGRMAAILIREGLNPFAEAITGGRLLKSAAFFATILSVVSAALGVLIMFYMCWTGSFVSASPGNLIVFMLCMLVTVLIVCGYVKLKK